MSRFYKHTIHTMDVLKAGDKQANLPSGPDYPQISTSANSSHLQTETLTPSDAEAGQSQKKWLHNNMSAAWGTLQVFKSPSYCLKKQYFPITFCPQKKVDRGCCSCSDGRPVNAERHNFIKESLFHLKCTGVKKRRKRNHVSGLISSDYTTSSW